MSLSIGNIFASDDSQSHITPGYVSYQGEVRSISGTGQNTRADLLTGLLKAIAGTKQQSQPVSYQQPGHIQQWIDPAFLSNPGSRFGDYDRDGIQNQYDRDLDGDGTQNEIDHFPVDNSHS